MRERAVTATPSLLETPILDPTVYLLQKQNKEFLEGRRATPLIRNRSVGVLLGLFVILMALSPAIIVSMVMAWQMTALDTLLGVGFVLLGIAAIVAVMGVQWLYRGRRTMGVVVPGEVVQAETIRVFTGRYFTERVRLRYRFEFPEGITQTGVIEAGNDHANSVIAPLPGTAIRVWYTDSGKYYVL